uniref:Target of EGR1 protein 1 n=1 Tax=Panagrolaimus sp. JU765 TaxID=591449 RepID=A0AC34R3Y7_9BILA
MFDETVPVIEINRLNLDRLWTYLQLSVKRADFIAVDLELSGLGNFSHLRDKPFQERYARIRESVQTRSILSIGLALFYLEKGRNETGDEKVIKMSCRVFNITTMAARPFTVEPAALKFLSKHGFDFNKLIETAIPYELKNLENPLCQLWETVLFSGASVIFHNGFLDLAFLYNHLFCELPEQVSNFQSCVCDWFENPEIISESDKERVGGRGLFYDNKYIAAVDGLQATFLEYVFRKYQRMNLNEHKAGRICLDIKFNVQAGKNKLIEDDIDFVDCTMSAQFLRNDFSINKETLESICDHYSSNGCCKTINCQKAHEVDLILDIECYQIQKKQNKQKRKHEHTTKDNPDSKAKSRPLPSSIVQQINEDEEMEETESTISDNSGISYEKTHFSTRGCHRAGMDAFMTGFGTLFSQRVHIFKNGTLDPKLANKTTSPGLEKPLPFIRSTYSPPSERHQELWDFLSRKKIEAVKMKSGIQ